MKYQLLPTPTLAPTTTPVADKPEMKTAVTDEATPIPPTPTSPPPPTSTPIPIPPTARLTSVDHQFQTWNNCGPATLAMTLSYFDIPLQQQDTAVVLKPDPEDRNVSPEEMTAFVNEQTAVNAISRANGRRETVQRLIAAGIPVIVEIGIDPPGEYRWLGWYGHYLLVVAYDEEAAQFWVYDSWFGTSEEPLENAHVDGRALPYIDFEAYWPHFNRNYIPLYRDDQAETVAEIIGADMDDQVMWQNALAAVQTETAVEPDNPFFWFNLGTIYNALGQYEEAATAFDQARAIGLPWRMLWYQFGPYEAYYQVGRFEDILLLAETTLKDRPYFEESYYYQGLALAALGQTDEALDSLEKAANFNPKLCAGCKCITKL